MSFFNNATKQPGEASSAWGGFLKQAGSLASTVGKGLDKVLDIQPIEGTGDDIDFDPITGMVTPISRTAPKPSMQPTLVPQRSASPAMAAIGLNSTSSSRPGTPTSERPASVGDKAKRGLASRLNAIMHEKAAGAKGEESEEERSVSGEERDIGEGEEEKIKEDGKEIDECIVEYGNGEEVVEKAESSSPVSSIAPKASDSGTYKDSILATKQSSVPRSSLEASDTTTFNLIIAQRERQLMNVMQDNAQLNETAEDLRTQLSARSTELDDALQRAHDLEARLEDLTSKFEVNQPGGPGLSKSTQKTIEEQRAQLVAKDEQIAGLMLEGEKLSKNELKHLTTIKKLRGEKTEKEKELLELQKKLDKVMGEQSDKDGKAAKASEGEKKANETVKALQDLTQTQTKQLTKIETELLGLREEKVTLSTALEKAYEELAEAKRTVAEASNLQQTQALEKEIKANESMHKELEQLRREAEETEIALRKEIRELQDTLSLLEEHAGQREDQLRQDVSNLQTRLQAAESCNEDLTAGLSDSTQPLLRQIEALQTQYSVALKSWEKTEKSLTERLRDAEAERSSLFGKEKVLSAKLTEVTARISDLESQLSTERHVTSRLNTELETERLRSAEIETRLNQVTTKLETLRATQARALGEVKENYQRLLRQQLQEEREQWEMRQRQEEETRAEKEKESERKRGRGYENRRSKLDIEITNGAIPNMLTRSLSFGSTDSPTSSSRSSFDSTTASSANLSGNMNTTVMIERLNLTVRQMEGQISFLQTQIQTTQHSRDELAEELVRMTVQLEELKGDTARVADLEKEQEELNQRYHASLELLGERTEQANELKADLADIKEMYRTQISDLMDRLNGLQEVRVEAAKK